MDEPTIFETESKFFWENREALSKEYPGQYLVVQGERVICADPDEDAAVDAGMKQLEGDFLVRHVDHPEDPISFTGLIVEVPPGGVRLDEGSEIVA